MGHCLRFALLVLFALVSGCLRPAPQIARVNDGASDLPCRQLDLGSLYNDPSSVQNTTICSTGILLEESPGDYALIPDGTDLSDWGDTILLVKNTQQYSKVLEQLKGQTVLFKGIVSYDRRCWDAAKTKPSERSLLCLPYQKAIYMELSELS